MKKKWLIFLIAFVVYLTGSNTLGRTGSYAQTSGNDDSLNWTTFESIDRAVTEGDVLEALKQKTQTTDPLLSFENPETMNYALGVVHALTGDLEAALIAFEKVIQSNAVEPIEKMQAYRRQLEIYFVQGHFRGMIETGLKLEALAKSSDFDNQPELRAFYLAVAYEKMAKAYITIGDGDRLAENLDLMLQQGISPEMGWVEGLYLLYQGDINISKQAYEIALNQYEKGLKQFQNDPKDEMILLRSVEYEMAWLYEMALSKRMTEPEAMAAIAKLLKKSEESPGGRPFERVLIHFYTSQVDALFNHHEAALEHLQQAEVLLSEISVPQHLVNNDLKERIRMYRAKAYYSLGNYKTAADVYSDIIFSEDVNPWSLRYEGDMRAVKAIEESDFRNQIELLDRLNSAKNEKMKFQTLLLQLSVGIALAVLFALGVLMFDYHRIKTLKGKLYLDSITDHLTQINNRAKIMDLLENQTPSDGMVAMLDIDYFKKINDTYGHQVGDEVLVQVAKTIKDAMRAGDHVGRFGGEEFLIIVNNATVQQCIQVCERIRTAVENLEWPYEGLKTSISVGMAPIEGRDIDVAIHEADTYLYEAKHAGRNQVKCEKC